jgi:aminomethyltransferase
LGRVVVTDKPAFVGRDAILAGPPEGAPVLVGLKADGKRAARAEYPVYSGDTLVGEITSGALSPTLGYPIAMAFVAPEVSALGTVLDLDVRGTRIPATVVALPFYSRS